MVVRREVLHERLAALREALRRNAVVAKESRATKAAA
jgi:hypothetical protein